MVARLHDHCVRHRIWTVREGNLERMSRSDDLRLVDNTAENRYELWVGDEPAGTLEYDTLPEAMVLIHTEVDPAHEGKGIGSRLVHDVLADIRSRDLKVVPRCAFVRSYLSRHPEEANVLRRGPADWVET